MQRMIANRLEAFFRPQEKAGYSAGRDRSALPARKLFTTPAEWLIFCTVASVFLIPFGSAANRRF